MNNKNYKDLYRNFHLSSQSVTEKLIILFLYNFCFISLKSSLFASILIIEDIFEIDLSKKLFLSSSRIYFSN